MPGGPIFPRSTMPITSGKVFSHVYGSDRGLGVMASLNGDAIWRLRFEMPPVMPTGTLKLVLRMRANATTGSVKLNPKWAMVAVGEDPAVATVTAEGVQTVTWASGDASKYKEVKVTLDAVTPEVGNVLAMDLTAETSGWTLAATLLVIAYLIWE